MLKFKINGETYIVELPEGYIPEKRVSFNRQERPGYYANNGTKRRWFRARLLKNITKEKRANYAKK
jgi:hypothetical protein